MDGDDRWIERTQRLYRLGDGVGDVVQLQVQEDRQVQLGHFPHPGAAIGGEELQPQLDPAHMVANRSEEHTSELQSLMRISYAVFCLKKNTKYNKIYI